MPKITKESLPNLLPAPHSANRDIVIGMLAIVVITAVVLLLMIAMKPTMVEHFNKITAVL